MAHKKEEEISKRGNRPIAPTVICQVISGGTKSAAAPSIARTIDLLLPWRLTVLGFRIDESEDFWERNGATRLVE